MNGTDKSLLSRDDVVCPTNQILRPKAAAPAVAAAAAPIIAISSPPPRTSRRPGAEVIQERSFLVALSIGIEVPSPPQGGTGSRR
jgi:hypothetical protein